MPEYGTGDIDSWLNLTDYNVLVLKPYTNTRSIIFKKYFEIYLVDKDVFLTRLVFTCVLWTAFLRMSSRVVLRVYVLFDMLIFPVSFL